MKALPYLELFTSMKTLVFLLLVYLVHILQLENLFLSDHIYLKLKTETAESFIIMYLLKVSEIHVHFNPEFVH